MFKNIIKLRDSLTDCATRNNQFVALAGGSVDPELESGSFQTKGCAVTYNKEAAGGPTVTYQSGGEKTISLSDLEEHLGDPIDDSGYVLGDLFNNASNTGDQYSTLAAITAKYSYSNRMTLTDVNAIIDSGSNVPSDNSEVSSLKDNLVSACDDDGFVTVNSWLSCLSSWFKSAYDAATDHATEIDDREPFVIQAIFDLVVSVIGQVISVILDALAIVFNAIFLIIGTIFKTLWGLFTKTTEGVDTSVNCPNEFVFGPVYHLEISDPDIEGYYPKDRSIYYKEGTSLGVFMWWNEEYTNMNVNAYNAIRYDASTVADWVRSNVSKITRTSDGFFWNPNESDMPILPDGETALQLATYDSTKFFECMAVGAFMQQFINIHPISQWLKYYEYTHNAIFDDGHYDYVTWFGVAIYGSVGSSNKLYNYGAYMVRNVLLGRDPWFGIMFNTIESEVHAYMTQQFNNGDNLNKIMGTNMGIITNLSDIRSANFPILTSNPNDYETCFVETTINADYYTIGWVYNDTDHRIEWGMSGTMRGLSKADSMPSNFRFKVEQITNNAVLLATSIVAVTATVAAVTVSKVAKALRIKKIKKSIKRMSRLNTAKAAYEENPTKETLNAYAKEVERYNRLGKMFGWGSYDAQNSWVDYPDGGDNVPDVSPLINDVQAKTQSSIQRLIQIAEQITQTQSDLEVLLRRISGE